MTNSYNQTTHQINDRRIFAFSQKDRASVGDSGAGVVLKEPGMRDRMLVAVLTGGSCELPSNNPMTPISGMRVSYYTDWILATTGVGPTG